MLKTVRCFLLLTVVFKGLQLLSSRGISGLAKLMLVHWTWLRTLHAMRTTTHDASHALRMHSTSVEIYLTEKQNKLNTIRTKPHVFTHQWR
jgi:hypothetical protein